MDWFFLFLVIGLGILIPTGYAGLIGAPYAPTPLKAIKKAFDRIGLGAQDAFVDLGAGDGKAVLEATRRGATAYGYELSPALWAVARLRTMRQPKAKILYKNFYTISSSPATVVFAFLMPKNMPRVRELLTRQRFPKGHYFIAYAFALPGVQPLTIVREPQCATMYIYDFKDLIS